MSVEIYAEAGQYTHNGQLLCLNFPDLPLPVRHDILFMTVGIFLHMEAQFFIPSS